MIATRGIALISVFLGLSSGAFADDTEALYQPASVPLDASLSPTAFLDTLEYKSLWRLSYPVDVISLSELQPHPLNDIRFEDSDLLSRLSKLRGVSMLTMAEIGAARLFFGVNYEGLVGLHFNSGASDPDARHVEMLRMPYLTVDPDDEIQPED